jgi:hypothetical protein
MSDFGRLQELAREAGLQINPPSNTVVPAVMPLTAVVGEALTCTMGEWTGEPTEYAYGWLIDGADTGAIGDTYTTVAGNEGHTVTCVVTATNGAGSAVAPPSNAVTVTATRAAPAKTEPAAAPAKTEPTARHSDAHSDARRDPGAHSEPYESKRK